MVDIPEPVPRAGEVKVRVHAASLNPLDWKVRAGHVRWLPMFRGPPRTPGCDFAGEIVGVSAGARSHYRRRARVRFAAAVRTRWRAGRLPRRGRRSAGDDAGEPRTTNRPPRCRSPAGRPCRRLADEARLGAGQRILITGAAGGVGHFAVQIAKHVGAHVVAVCGAANADFVRGLSAPMKWSTTRATISRAATTGSTSCSTPPARRRSSRRGACSPSTAATSTPVATPPP